MYTLKYGTTSINYILHTQNRKDLKISVTLVNGEKKLIEWYRKQGAKKLQERVTYYQSLLNVQPSICAHSTSAGGHAHQLVIFTSIGGW